MRRTRSPHSSSAYRSIIHHGTSSSSSQQSTPNPSALLRSFESDTNPARPIRPSPLTTASPIPDMPLDLLERIRSFPLFSSAPEEFLVAVGSHLRPQIHAGHDHILTEGEEARAMYWLVRGVVAVTSRDGEAVYAELKPGAFFGEIGVLMDVPRTATIIARTKCLLVVLMKEDLMAELPRFPEMEKAIRQEALERLAILKKKKRLSEGAEAVLKVGEQQQQQQQQQQQERKKHEGVPGEVVTGDVGVIKGGAVVNTKKRKSPSPGVIEDPAVSGSALGSAYVNVRKTLKELPLFATLPADILHFLGLSAQPKSYPPFTDIVRQGTRGSEIYFIVHGEAEVVKEPEEPLSPTMVKKNGSGPATSYTRPRLRQGQYFGEVASLGLSEERTATVRAITTVECLVIGGEALEELWRRCPPEIRAQVEETARKRFHKARQEAEREDVEMSDVGDENVGPTEGPVIITPVVTQMLAADEETRSPTDPDPYLSVDMENLRARRRSSIAPPPAQTADSSGIVVGGAIKIPPVQPAPPLLSPVSLDEPPFPFKRARLGRDSAKEYSLSKQGLPDNVLVAVFKHLDLLSMLKIRAVCRRWRTLLTTSADLCTHVDLSPYNRRVTDHAIIHILAPFIGARPVEININDCFHITDEGFHCLWKTCGRNVKVWRMRSVWDVSAAQIHNMAEYAKGLEEIDWSSCRKVGDNLLARVAAPPSATSTSPTASTSPTGRWPTSLCTPLNAWNPSP
ncbi:uncharacterized protein CTHT_0074140 [Thermochaetoides thermophila DSM 1495]|uniref:Cyclic nucleotide-binding domain-containing protein n=1 Tax=Chaetomium thermophilum (strain DSM 1495 / CBS 144.50 / IMI 039719) TaxID=759272 RepID=G0SI15_CHATD|nr:hypothetical protein CTHT_0074140 [Thermochaetoides thermophila DSM 1495]EGS17085.1 hypothetical protein CTHT_0074140 [Thermochaetoides thermophila DSM 1495]